MNQWMMLFAFLDFGSWGMLWWAGAASAPVIIHLLTKRRYRVMDWAAMRYLKNAIRKRSKRIQLEQLLLLFIRTAIILLLVIALAQPYSQQMFSGGPTGKRTHRVIVLDGSFSMAYQADDSTRFQHAKTTIKEIVNRSSQGDGFTLLLMSAPPQVIVGTPAYDPSAFLDEVEQLQLPHGRADLPTTIEKVEELIRKEEEQGSQLEHVEVHFVTDLGRASWVTENQAEETVAQFRKRCEKLSSEAAFVLWDVSGTTLAENSAVTDLRLLQQFATVVGKVEIEAQIEHFGRQTKSKQQIEFLVDGKLAGEEEITLPPQVPKTVRFQYQFTEGGDHEIMVRLKEDLLPLDNQRWLSVPVKEAIHVLCINGNPTGNPFEGATEYLRIALNPNDAQRQRAVVVPEVMTENALLEVADLNRYECIFLCNMRRFTRAEAKRLDTYLENGGGLVFFLGDRVLPESYNRWLAGEDPQGVNILPAKLGAIQRREESDEPFQLDPLEYKHPLVSVFRGNPLAGLVHTPINQYYELKIPPDAKTKVALSIADGGPLMVETPVHRGHVVLVATSADTTWNQWPKWHSYVPVIHELLNFAISQQEDTKNQLVGQSLSTTVRTLVPDLSVSVETPSQKREKVSMIVQGETSLFGYHQTQQSGIYTVEFGPPLSTKRLFAVNVDPIESDLTKLDLAELKQEVWPDPIRFYTEPPDAGTDWVPDFNTGIQSQWSWMILYAVLFLLFLETLLAWMFARHVTTPT